MLTFAVKLQKQGGKTEGATAGIKDRDIKLQFFTVTHLQGEKKNPVPITNVLEVVKMINFY